MVNSKPAQLKVPKWPERIGRAAANDNPTQMHLQGNHAIIVVVFVIAPSDEYAYSIPRLYTTLVP